MKTNGAVKAVVALVVVGASLIAYATQMPRYKDEQLFMERYMALGVGQSDQYWSLRDEMLTPKFELQDYGLTLIALAAVVFLITRSGKVHLSAPRSRATLVALSLALPFVTVGAYVFDLFQGFERDEFPHWADSLGIPLMAVPAQLVVLLGWSMAHLALMHRRYVPAPLGLAVSRESNLWLLCISGLTAALVIWSVLLGQYWYAIPGALWLYVYLSLGAARRAAVVGVPDC